MARIVVEPNPDFRAWSVNLTTVNELPRVANAIKLGDTFTKQDFDSDHRAYVVLQASEDSKRVAKAFQHAAALCGGKASPF